MTDRRTPVIVAALVTLAVVFAGGWFVQGSLTWEESGSAGASGSESLDHGVRLERVGFASAHTEDVPVEVTVRRGNQTVERRSVTVQAAEKVGQGTYEGMGIALPLGLEVHGEDVLVLDLPAGSERVHVSDRVEGNCAAVSVTVEGPGDAWVQVLEC